MALEFGIFPFCFFNKKGDAVFKPDFLQNPLMVFRNITLLNGNKQKLFII